LSLQVEQVPNYIDQLEREAKAFKEEAIRLSWFMRGGVTYEDAMCMSQDERQIITNLDFLSSKACLANIDCFLLNFLQLKVSVSLRNNEIPGQSLI